MFSSIHRNIFWGFVLLIVFSFVSLVWTLNKQVLESEKTYLFDLTSLQADLITKEINSKTLSLQAISEAYGIGLMTEEKIFGQNHFDGFDTEDLQNHTPVSGSVIFECQDKIKQNFFCTLAKIPESNVTVFRASQFPTFIERFFVQLNQMKFSLLLLAVLAGLFTYLVAQQLKARENELQQAGFKLAHSERLASIGQMGASIAHEVKNPLMALQGHAKLLKKLPSISEEAAESLEIIVKESDRCQQILQQMLRFSRNEKAIQKAFSLQEILRSTELLCKAEAKAKTVQLQIKCSEDRIITAIPQHVQQVLVNLVINAIHASPSQGCVAIEAKDVSNQLIEISVVDNGAGIPKTIQDRIFQPFFTTKEAGQGTGLGLAVSASLLEEQSINLHFESRPGLTRFWFQLPRAIS